MKAKVVTAVSIGILLLFLTSTNHMQWSASSGYFHLDSQHIVTHKSTGTGTHSVQKSAREKMVVPRQDQTQIPDGVTVRLSQQAAPAFDPAFKNPCWWIENESGNKTLACLPYFYLAGFPKSGTTDLFVRLTNHPLLAMPRSKEPHFLTRSFFSVKKPKCLRDTALGKEPTSCGILRYVNRFFNTSAQIILRHPSDKLESDWQLAGSSSKRHFRYPMITVDGSASTMWDNHNGYRIIRDIALPERVAASNSSISDWILRMNPGVSIVVIMRDPVSRLYSDYNFFNHNTTPAKFHTLVSAFIQSFQKCLHSGLSHLACARLSQQTSSSQVRGHIGMYYLYLEEWLLRLPRDRIHVIRSEDYQSDMRNTLQNLFTFLDLPKLSPQKLSQVTESTNRNVNKRNVDPIWPQTRQMLIEFYRPFNQKLAKLLHDESFLWQDVYDKYTI